MDESLLDQLQGLSLSPQKDQLTLKDVQGLWSEFFTDDEISIEILRALRKLAAGLNPHQKAELQREYPSLFQFTLQVMNSPRSTNLSRVALQFLFNVYQGSMHIEGIKAYEDVLMGILRSSLEDPKTQDYASSLLFLGIKGGILFNEGIYPLLLTATIRHESHFALLALQEGLKENFSLLFRALSTPDNKSALIQILCSHEEALLASGVQVSSLFKEHARRIMNAANGSPWSKDEVFEVPLLLDALVEASSKGKTLQEDRDLLIDALHLLKMVHLASSSDPTFTPIRKLSDVSDEDKTNSAFGFKRDLIRLLGNLVYEHEGNQGLIGSLDGLALILDCSPIDGKNPFITQWVVFAVRNLTRGNPKNQEIIAEMEKAGKLDRKLLVDSGIILS
eukprot:TRINITY_DN4452_c0_g1_i1.p1 TRINITY_DN4452_c0_g1~~TRINITY_DN4452_c0_g1_i1.p1  ORF type:complete len:392 (-),score=73.50 TRINITY_DN4452_c0_g1_i1:417-1592(-)